MSPAHHPFCGQGCRDRDLLRWLSDDYRLPADDERDAEENEPRMAGLDRRGPTLL